MIYISGLEFKMFDLIRKFTVFYSSKLDHWDKFWDNEREGSMVQIHGDILKNIARLSGSMTLNIKQAIEALVGLAMISFYNYQRTLRKPFLKGRFAGDTHVLEYATRTENIKNLIFFFTNIGSNNEGMHVLLNRFFIKDIKSDEAGEDIRRILK